MELDISQNIERKFWNVVQKKPRLGTNWCWAYDTAIYGMCDVVCGMWYVVCGTVCCTNLYSRNVQKF